jgi:ATP-dependent RNA helicase DDX23/PRP28
MDRKRHCYEDDGSYARPMSAEEEIQAKKMMEIAERAEKRASERMSQQQQSTSSTSTTITNNIDKNKKTNLETSSSSSSNSSSIYKKTEEKPIKAKFLTKKERELLALERLHAKSNEKAKLAKEENEAHIRFTTGKAVEERRREERLQREREDEERIRREKDDNKDSKEHDYEVKAIRDHYLGISEKKVQVKKPSDKRKIFKFDWEEKDDTGRNDVNPLYNNRVTMNALFGRGYIAGTDQREQRKKSNFLETLSDRRMDDIRRIEEQDDRLTEKDRRERERLRDQYSENLKRKVADDINDMDTSKIGLHWSEKALEDMSIRDWRIFKEDFDIRIQGGKSTLPLRFWKEAHFPDQVMKAIDDAGYKEPSPIQRQAIPIGLSYKDIIGIAETGSGKTASFTIPLLCYLLNLPQSYVDRCEFEGPLAVIMAPTRELAQQIDTEVIKLASYTNFSTCCIVGGQSIEDQAFTLRQGVQIVIGTPGRLCDCILSNFLVLNQCNYVVLDEADRMIDMGFEPQVVEVLEAMGGLLKSEDEDKAMLEAETAQKGQELYRVTAMFSATMSSEVEKIAKKFLRHPVIIKIGDKDSGKNKRIEQIVHFISESQKRTKILEDLRRHSNTDKCIVFINAKKQGDMVGKQLEQAGFRVGILHGGRSQDQREDTLEQFRNGNLSVLVATDVAGRGLDIQDVTHVYNFDLPSKIENYCHRIGRTGRAGKSGIATSYLTDSDTEIMYDLKQYLESTNSSIPDQLQRHPSAQNKAGTRDERGNIMGQKRDNVRYSSK